MTKIYLLTGAAGFVGNNTARMLAAQGKKVRALVNSQGKEKIALKEVNAEIYFGDVRNPADLEQLFVKGEVCEYIFIHAASVVDITSNRFNKKLHDINVGGIKNVIAACKAHRVKRLVYVSSVHAIKEPANKALTKEPENYKAALVHGVYAKTKAEASACVLEAVKQGLNAVMVHPSGIIGPNDFSNTHMTQMIIDFASGRIPGAINGGYDFVDVRDVAMAIISACDKGASGSRWILSGSFVTIREMLETLSNLLGIKKQLPLFPMWLARIGAPFMWIFAKLTNNRPLYTSYALYTLRSNGNFCSDKAKAELGFKPRSFNETLSDTLKFLNENGMIGKK